MWCMWSAGCGCKRFDYDPNMKYAIMSDNAGHILYWEFYV